MIEQVTCRDLGRQAYVSNPQHRNCGALVEVVSCRRGERIVMAHLFELWDIEQTIPIDCHDLTWMPPGEFEPPEAAR